MERDAARGKRIEEAMRRQGLWDTEVGRQINVSRETVHRWRKGGPLDPGNLTKLAEALGLDRAAIMDPGPDSLEDAAAGLAEETQRREAQGDASET